MWTLEQIIKRGRAEIGQAEQPLGSNCIKYNDWYYGFKVSGAEFPWCAAFMSWLFLAADTGIAFPLTPACVTIYNFAKELGRLVEGDYQPGDVVIYRYNAWSKTFDHTGLVVERRGEHLLVLEGNYADKVCLVDRAAECIIGAYRPQYGENDEASELEEDLTDAEPAKNVAAVELPELSNGATGNAVKILQSVLRTVYNISVGPWGVDGDFGNDTENAVRVFQAGVNIASTGKVDAATWKALLEGKK